MSSLCPACHRLLERGAVACSACGRPLAGMRSALDLVAPGGTRIPLVANLTIGRAPGSDVVLDDPTVSRVHAHVRVDGEVAAIEDAGSSYGTLLDGQPLREVSELRPGMRLALGDCELRVEPRRDEGSAGRTVTVRPGASLVLDAAGRPERSAALTGDHLRVRSGWSLKRLDSSEGDKRWVLKDLRSDRFVQLADGDARMFEALDGSRDIAELMVAAEQEWGQDGPARLARLVADLAERGMLAGSRESSEDERGWMARALSGREWTTARMEPLFAAAYRRGGYLLFTRPARWLLGLLALAGLAAFAWLVGGRYGTPFVVARKVGLGAVVFILGRFLVVLLHELAHGLAMSALGRPVARVGIKRVLFFPYLFVDTSNAWFESRGRRMLVGLAGPISDLALGGAFSLASALAGGGTLRDVLFQLALGAYVSAFFNLNPLLERDGYMVLVDYLRQPGLQRRAREQVGAVLRGRAPEGPRVLLRYGFASLAWSFVGVGFAILMGLRYESRLRGLAPPAVAWGVLAGFCLLLCVPLAFMVLRPLLERGRDGVARSPV